MFKVNNETTLNSLIASTLDSVDGYRSAAEQAENPALKQAFTARATEREEIVRTFQDKVRAIGGNPEDDGTVLAGAHRVFLKLRDAVTGNDDDAVVAEVERGEDHLKAKYDDALRDDDIDSEVRTMIQTAYDSVRKGHDQMSNLKHAMGAR